MLAAELGVLGPDVKLDEVPRDVFLCLKFPVLQRSCSGKFEVRACADASVAGQLETATTNCGFRQKKSQ